MNKLTRLVGVKFTESDYDKLKLIADAKKRKVSDLVRITIQSYLELNS